ncbi:hypothetical protein sS8_1096 [Methylocaldum marinum]|uniref:Uncharacterized protein n=1 Tax=Methylocaldum marinum TaxID=1432792 RepID=A0A250KNB4_9GAMM|nr:hypothetical protein sS8_1096 [Methylocaldum marinum]
MDRYEAFESEEENGGSGEERNSRLTALSKLTKGIGGSRVSMFGFLVKCLPEGLALVGKR